MLPLTRQAQLFIEKCIGPASSAIDATVGNGHDLKFLCKALEPGGKIYAFDVQEVALETARHIVDASSMGDRVQLILDNHANMERHFPGPCHGAFTAIMFNLGYLPGGDPSMTTRAETTIEALDTSLSLLAPGGRMSVVCYPGHKGGDDETRAVLHWVDALDRGDFIADRVESQNPGPRTPVLILVERTAPQDGQKPIRRF